MNIDVSSLFSKLPEEMKQELLGSYQRIASNFAEHRWEPSELNGGKFCEATYAVIIGTITNKYNLKALAEKKNIVDAWRSVENMPPTGHPADRSLRLLIPRMLLGLYQIRNDRGVGHISGDVNPNAMDALFVFSTSSWILCELIRIFHNVKIDEAQAIVDAISERKIPLVWDSGLTKRVLDNGLSIANQTLLLLHQSASWVSDRSLLRSTEYSNASNYRKNILGKLHRERLLEYNKENGEARITPKGSAHVEKSIVMPSLAVHDSAKTEGASKTKTSRRKRAAKQKRYP